MHREHAGRDLNSRYGRGTSKNSTETRRSVEPGFIALRASSPRRIASSVSKSVTPRPLPVSRLTSMSIFAPLSSPTRGSSRFRGLIDARAAGRLNAPRERVSGGGPALAGASPEGDLSTEWSLEEHPGSSCQIRVRSRRRTVTSTDPQVSRRTTCFLASGHRRRPPTATTVGQNCHAGGRGFASLAPALYTSRLCSVDENSDRLRALAGAGRRRNPCTRAPARRV